MVPALRPYFWCFVLALSLAAACRQYYGPAEPTPTPVIRAGDLYTCANGLDNCRVTYRIGPVTQSAGRLRVHFTVSLDGPRGGTTQWTNDRAFHEFLKGQGQRGIALTLASDHDVVYELEAVGGIASTDEMLVAPVMHEGYWEFLVPEPAGSVLLLTYPDFIDSPAPVVVPE